MKFEQILELVKAVSDSKLTSFKYQEGETEISMKKGETVVQQIAAPVVQQGAPVVAVQPTVSEAATVEVAVPEGNVVTCPLVGTFYAAPSEDAAAFVKVGDTVKKGQTLAIVEAMKLMNEIESDFDGVVMEVLVENATGVEYGQPLFVIK